jgi:hypothetical protein
MEKACKDWTTVGLMSAADGDKKHDHPLQVVTHSSGNHAQALALAAKTISSTQGKRPVALNLPIDSRESSILLRSAKLTPKNPQELV